MNMSEWARNEIEIACKKEDPENKEWDYGTACYKSAYKAFQSLMEDGHSGMSIEFTKVILNRLIDGKPLTPITDDDFFVPSDMPKESEEYLKCHNLKSDIQCPRMSSLFREEDLEGNVSYTDVERIICYDINRKSGGWHSSLCSRLIDEIYPITMPYSPSSKPIEVYCEEFLTNPVNGDFDTYGIFYAIIDGNRVEINKFYNLDEETKEISEAEYQERKKKSIELNEQKNDNSNM